MALLRCNRSPGVSFINAAYAQNEHMRKQFSMHISGFIKNKLAINTDILDNAYKHFWSEKLCSK